MNTRTLNISLPPQMVDQLDRVAEQRAANRSELIRDALRSYLRRRKRWETLFAIGERQAKKRGLTEDDVLRAVREVRGKSNA